MGSNPTSVILNGKSLLDGFTRCLRFRAKVEGQFARAVKGLDLRSNAGHCAWVRTPQLTRKIWFRLVNFFYERFVKYCSTARLAQLVERKALNLVVVGSSPTVGVLY